MFGSKKKVRGKKGKEKERKRVQNEMFLFFCLIGDKAIGKKSVCIK